MSATSATRTFATRIMGSPRHRSSGTLHDERRVEIIVVDDDTGTVPRRALAKVDLLAFPVAPGRGLLEVQWRRAPQPVVPDPFDAQEDREVPRRPQLGPVQEEPVEEQDRP